MSRRGPRKRDLKSQVIRVRLSEGLYQRLMDHADKTHRTVSEIVRVAIRAWIKKEHEDAGAQKWKIAEQPCFGCSYAVYSEEGFIDTCDRDPKEPCPRGYKTKENS